MIKSNIIDNSSTSAVKAKVELYDGSTLVKTCTCGDVLQEFVIDRAGDNSKFFGFGVCQKLGIKLIDLGRELTVTTANTIDIAYEVEKDGRMREAYLLPTYFVTEVNRDEDTNLLSITAYDPINAANEHFISEVTLTAPYTIRECVAACSVFLGLDGIEIVGVKDTETCFDTSYSTGANLEGTEYIRDVLDAIAEVTQTVYYVNHRNKLVFKRFDMEGGPALTITKDDYFTLHTQTNRRLSAICSATELGDNVEASLEESGTTQYVRDNPFWELREDVGTLVESALAAVGGLTINQFDCEWAGNLLLEVGDKIELITEDGGSVFSYFLNDSFTFDGTVWQFTEWTFEDNDGETASNPTSLGEALNKTFAKVDKANKQITLFVNEVTEKQASTDSELDIIRENQTSLIQTANDINIRVETIEIEGVHRVETSTGFTFDKEGLRINKDNSGIENLLDNTGMYVKQDDTEVLSANEKGVKAKDLHAVTYLWIGSHSRFEDYEGGRTGCFWISE